VLSIDASAMTAQVEGQVLIGDLCRATLPLGLVPAAVPEFPDFTIAGLVCGEGIQSSSHRYGAFSHTILDVEVALGDGSLVRQHAEEVRVFGRRGLSTCAPPPPDADRRWM
jgi:delta24-sterol reductase